MSHGTSSSMTSPSLLKKHYHHFFPVAFTVPCSPPNEPAHLDRHQYTYWIKFMLNHIFVLYKYPKFPLLNRITRVSVQIVFMVCGLHI